MDPRVKPAGDEEEERGEGRGERGEG
jgi:hypothetical protein